MAYYFMVECEKGKYIPLDITKSDFFQMKPKYKKIGAHTLQEIDLFTVNFNSDEELKKELILTGILPTSLADKPISIRVSNKDNYDRIKYGLLLQKDSEYLSDPSLLIKEIMKRYYNNDFEFIKKLADAFLHYYECRMTASEVRELMELSINQGSRSHYLNQLDEHGDNLVKRLIKLLIIEYYQNPLNRNIEYTNKINYKNLHDVIAFMNHYDKNIKKQEESKEENTNSNTHTLVKQKKLFNPYIIEKQLTLDDMK